jgi:hypothetical protein
VAVVVGEVISQPLWAEMICAGQLLERICSINRLELLQSVESVILASARCNTQQYEHERAARDLYLALRVKNDCRGAWVATLLGRVDSHIAENPTWK